MRFLLCCLWLAAVASALRTLNSKRERQDSGLGCPPPRHGLRLLSWYVGRCLDNNDVAVCDPTKGDFGFHQFFNKEKVLPVIGDQRQLANYSLGNLTRPGARRLPPHVRNYYEPGNPRSNLDRVVVTQPSVRPEKQTGGSSGSQQVDQFITSINISNCQVVCF